MARQEGLKDGWAIDLTCVDPEDGQPWDLSDPGKQRKTEKMVDEDKPLMLIMSPECGPFSRLNEVFNYPKADQKEVWNKIKNGLEHLKFAMKLCLKQHEQGRLFMFEHPVSASSWGAQVVEYIAGLDGVFKVNFDFCMLGMETVDDAGDPAAAKKRTGILTNSMILAMLLRDAQCRGEHVHTQLLGDRASAAQIYPDKFCRLVCEAVKREKSSIEWRNRMQVKFDITGPMEKLLSVQQAEELATPPDEDPMAELYRDSEFVDDTSGIMLDKGMAIAARRLEIEYFRKMGVYSKVRREKWMRTITTRWLDTNKGDEESPNYRARLVAREIKKDKREDLFAATPPLESLRMVVSVCASNQLGSPDTRFIIMATDVKRAYFYAPATRPIYIEIPAEDFDENDDDYVGVLNLSLYGTRDAAMNWSKTYSDYLVEIGFVKGRASPCNFFHPRRNISVTVHGDDFTSTGTEPELRWLDGRFKAKFEVKADFLGPGANHVQELRVLNRVLTCGGGVMASATSQTRGTLRCSSTPWTSRLQWARPACARRPSTPARRT